MKILVIGTTSWDTIITINEFSNKPKTIFSEKYKETLGGTAAGKSLSLAKLGFNVKLITKFAKDIAGSHIKASLDKEKIPCHIIEDELSTEQHTNLMNASGQRISIYTHYGKSNQFFDKEEIENAINEADLIFIDICEFVKYLFPILKKHKEKIWLDIHDYDGKIPWHKEFISYSNAIFMSSDSISSREELTILVEELIKEKNFVVCTHGKAGSEIILPNKERYFQGVLEKFQLVDSNGAGDSFISGFTYGYSIGESSKNCLKYGTLVSGLNITSETLCSEKLSIEWLKHEFGVNYSI